MQTYFIYWLIYSFIGWILETIYCSIPAKKFVERGFLYGPLVPIYGFGAMTILFVLDPFLNNPLLVFLLGILLTSSLEYITSYIMEKAFDMRWWDYSKRKFNINGRVCLRNSLMFGALSVILVVWVHPTIISEVSKLAFSTQHWVTVIAGSIIIIDFVITLVSTLNLKKYLKELKDIKDEIGTIVDNFEEKQIKRRDELTERYDAVKNKLKFSERRILRSFPTSKSIKFPEHLDELKKSMFNRK
ncbi:MAG: putative ABC transporter permease [Erysipelothrix sp.]